MRPTAEIATRVVFREKSAVAGALCQRSTMPNDDDRPATKQDLNDLRNELHGSIDRLREELVEQMRDMQTEVLRAFHGWASPIEIRLRALPNMEERLVLLEERVSGIERREKRT
jgi:hypothetical protein